MLVLTRKAGERLVINDNITVIVHRIAGNRVTIGVEAPNDVRIVRGELNQAVNEFRDSSESQKPGTRKTGNDVADVVPFPSKAQQPRAPKRPLVRAAR